MKRYRMITRETAKGVFYVDLIAEWRNGTPLGDEEAPKKQPRRRRKGPHG